MSKPTDKPTPPKHFSAELAAWWLEYVTEFDLDASERQVLTMLGDTWSQYLALQTSLDAAGAMTFTDRFGCPKERPELSAMNRCKITFARLRRELRLPIEEPQDQRLPRMNGAHA